MGDRNYGLTIIWANPSQVRVPSMEEAVGKLTACASSGTNWPYALVWLHKGTHHAPLPREGHLGVLPQRGVDATHCGQISQLEVHQLLVTGPQFVYPIGLNGHNEPIITSLPETLASGISLTAGKPVYLGIDILPPSVEEPDQKVLSLGEVSTIMVASPHKSLPKSEGEGSMTMKVRNLLSQAILETSGCGSKNLTPRRPNPVVIPMTPPHESKELLQPVGTSSQVSVEMAEASLEGIPPNISPIATVSRPESVTPPIDPVELWGNANKAPKELLTTKASIDYHRQRAIWELGMELCQNKSQTTESIKEAKAVCSWVALNAKTACSLAVKEAKTTRAHTQAESLQRVHGNVIWDLEEQSSKRRAEVKPTSSLSTRSPCMPAHQSSKALWLFPTTFYWGKHLHHLHSSCHRGLPCARTAHFCHSTHISAQAVS